MANSKSKFKIFHHRGEKMSQRILHSYNKRVSGSGFQLSPKSPSATSDTRQPLCKISRLALEVRLKQWKLKL